MAAALAGASVLPGCGGGGDEADPKADPFDPVERRAERTERSIRAAPRWEPVKTLRGSGDTIAEVDIAAEAIQWRVRWRCEKGRFSVALRPPPKGEVGGSGRCPGKRTVELFGSGRVKLDVRASSRWRMVIEQQVDTPLREPPLPAMRASGATVLARGRFYPLERRGRGAALLYRLPDGRTALRLDGFRTSANTDLFVWLSRDPRPKSTVAALRAPHEVIGPLRSTLGDLNYVLPKGTDVDGARSVVIWCEPVRIAYTAASLVRRSG